MLPSASMTRGAAPGLERLAGEGGLVELDPQPGLVGDADVAVLEHQGFPHQVAGRPALVGLVFEDQEVGRRGREVHGHGRGDRPERAVRGDRHIMGLGHRRDLLGLEQAAADQEVGLEDVRRAGGEDVAEGILGVEHLARRDRHADLARSAASAGMFSGRSGSSTNMGR